MPRLKGLFVLRPDAYDAIYGPAQRAAIAEQVDMVAPPQTKESVSRHPEMLRDVEVLFSGWGAPLVDAALLAHAPRLRAIFYGSGSIKGFVTDAVWERGILVTSAQAINAIPVAEYTLAAILFSLKHVWPLVEQTRREQRFPTRDHVPGVYGATVGIIGLGLTGRLLRERLYPFGVRVIAYDPYVSSAEAAELDVAMCPLETLFCDAQVVSLHAPLLPETVGMVNGTHLASMPSGATFINTARGGLVRQEEMIAVLTQRRDLYAVLDVTEPEPPPPGSALYSLPNVTLTPHIAGSLGSERRRMGQTMVEELQRFVAGQPLLYAITREQVQNMATP
ncbi:MAG: hydroxyacid dehydrogenase [Ktedonobacteraceae bacterium]|nr:hydroxyacid dehydrogenase [Ktedonobacteraceae bacterium]